MVEEVSTNSEGESILLSEIEGTTDEKEEEPWMVDDKSLKETLGDVDKYCLNIDLNRWHWPE